MSGPSHPLAPRLKAPPRPLEPKALQALSIFSPKYDVSVEILMKVVRAFQWEPKDFETPETLTRNLNPNPKPQPGNTLLSLRIRTAPSASLP